ncbi:MAG: ribosomal protein S18-alanine N-acetyltransferase [Burkholderiales bacterium]
MSAVPRSSINYYPSISYHPMRESDLAAVIAIEEKIYEFPWTLGNFRDSLRAGYPCWLCRDGDVLLGYSVLMNAAGEVHLLNLSIAGEHQRRGHGARLLVFLIANARAMKAEKIILEVRPSNPSAQKLYAGFGFKQIGVRRDYYPAAHGREDAWVFALEL